MENREWEMDNSESQIESEIGNQIAWGSQVQIGRGTDGRQLGEPTRACAVPAL